MRDEQQSRTPRRMSTAQMAHDLTGWDDSSDGDGSESSEEVSGPWSQIPDEEVTDPRYWISLRRYMRGQDTGA